ncbi:hypothetical protein OG921_15940 [Aldersonia sp. NBC_00410]|uniref:hypothetical protein n=1 Tax=Aldersonia sp. NBC_00410 TaxID=2975954 RepID=UPI0022556403|nr:hypothetical protein [Aldersonia sp. NBC_00410]MCX5044659.1 hypothetical protein [Aldersonia sp. NBC_00410]
MTRTLQALPVADAICSPGRQVIFPERGDHELLWGSDLKEALLSQCTRVNFGVAPPHQDIMPVGDETLRGAHLAERLAEHIGPQRLPFDKMWFEGTWPGRIGDWVPRAQEVAVYTSTSMRDRTTGRSTLITGEFALTLFFLMTDGSIARFPVAVLMRADAEGIPQRIRYASYSDAGSTNEQDRAAMGMVLPTLWAIGLMNCRNVKTQEIHRPSIKTKKMRRARNTGALSYHTIVLPRQRGEGGGGHIPTGRTRLHMVRGHFATYTRDAPLFGKHTGTFWKPWHLAGSPDAGVVESDYKLDASRRG